MLRCTLKVLCLHEVDTIVNGTDCDVDKMQAEYGDTCCANLEVKIAIIDAAHCDVVAHQRGITGSTGGKIK